MMELTWQIPFYRFFVVVHSAKILGSVIDFRLDDTKLSGTLFLFCATTTQLLMG